MGEVLERPCVDCRGDGRIVTRTKLEVDVPRGIHDGQQIRVRGEGHAGFRTSERGHAFVVVRVRPDERFVRDGDDLHTALRLTMTEAALGYDRHRSVHLSGGRARGAARDAAGRGARAAWRGDAGASRVEPRLALRASRRRRADHARRGAAHARRAARREARRRRVPVARRGRRLLRPPEERAPLSALVRVAFVVQRSESEIARAWLVAHAPEGFEERVVGDDTELAVYADETGVADIRAAFPQATVEPVPAGWEDRWKEFHRPATAGGLWIGPPWIAPPADRPAIVVDPGRAFGTGAHPTTRACIEALSRLERGSLLDAGCGSGVVAVAAVRLGFDPVWAVDVDEVAVEVAAETARQNDVVVDVRRADVVGDELPASDVAVANIELAVVERMLERLQSRVAVTSGYLASESPDAAGWTPVERVELEGWAADVLAKRH